MKIHHFIEEKETKRDIITSLSRKKLRNTDRKRTKEKLICTPQISTKTRRFQLQSCRITEQLNAKEASPASGR